MMRKKILYVGAFKGFWVSDGYRKKGFERIFDTEIFDFRATHSKDNWKMLHELQLKVYDMNPHIVFLNKAERITPLILYRIKKMLPNTFMVVFNGDQRGHAQPITSRLAPVVDGILINNKHEDQWNEYYGAGAKRIYEYHTAADIDVYRPRSEKIVYDVIFIGGNYGDRFPLSRFRVDCIRKLAKSFIVAVAGGNYWRSTTNIRYVGNRYGEDYSKYVSKSAMVLGINAYDNIENYTSNRTWISMACGRPYLCHTYLGAKKFFKDGEHLLFFRTYNELEEKVQWVLDNPKKAERIGDNGRQLILEKHTYVNRAKQLLNMYEDWRES